MTHAKHAQLNAAIRCIRDYCKEQLSLCTECSFWKQTVKANAMGTHDCMFNDRLPEDWEELPK